MTTPRCWPRRLSVRSLPAFASPEPLRARDTWELIKLIVHRTTGCLLGGTNLTTVDGLTLAVQAFEKDVAKLSGCAGYARVHRSHGVGREESSA